MIKKIIFLVNVILLILILKTGHQLRVNSSDIIPKVHLDEYTWIWQGISIRRTGIPAGWSDLNAYTKGRQAGEVINFNVSVDQKNPNLSDFNKFPKPAMAIPTLNLGEGDKQIRYVQPLIEQPPLGGIILSSYIDAKVDKLLDVTPLLMRQSSLSLALVTSVLLFALSFQLSKNPWISLLATAIYNSAPSFILMSRYALPENALTPTVLLLFNLLIFSQKLRGKWLILLLIIAGIVAGIATLIKVTGWPFILSGIFLLMFWRYQKKYILIFLTTGLLIGSLFFIWGIYLDPKLFFEVIFTQGLERTFIGSINFLASVFQIRTANFPLDGWWVGGFLTALLIPFRKENTPIYLGLLTTLITALFFGGSLYPWYLIPAIPFICMTSAIFIWNIITKPNFISIMVFFLIFFSSSFYWGYGVFKDSFLLYRVLLIFFLVYGVLLSFKKVNKYRFIWIGLMLILVYQMIVWNNQSVLYILSNWGRLPFQFMP